MNYERTVEQSDTDIEPVLLGEAQSAPVIAPIFLQQTPKYLKHKRLFDILVAFWALVITSPLMLVVSILIFLSDGFPLLYKQQRVGKGGKLFTIFKLRTMRKDADSILENDHHFRLEFEENFKLKSDPRVIGVGRWIRAMSIDEFPQLINVLRGEMSIVGPRPVLQREIEVMYGENACFYLALKPGCAGLWQCSGRNDTTYEKRVQLDKEYVLNASMKMDAEICVKTFVAVILKHGAS